jgi:hypothetical protein
MTEQHATAEHTVPANTAAKAPPPQKVTDGSVAAADRQASAGLAQAASPDAGGHSKSGHGHVAFLKVPEEEKVQRAQERKRWREPLYELPVGMCHHECSNTTAARAHRGLPPCRAPCQCAVL